MDPVSGELAVRDGADTLDRLATARALLAASTSLSEVKEIRDRALALRRYTEAKKLGAEMTGQAQEIANRAERRIGQLLAETPREPGPGRGKTLASGASVSARQQVGYATSKRAQQLAGVPDDVFDQNAAKPAKRLLRVAREAAAGQRRTEPAEPVTDAGGIRIEHGDFRSLPVADGTADLVFTDPPYPAQYLPLWADLAKHAARWLKPGRPVIAYAAEYHLPAIFASLGAELEYVWTIKLQMAGPGARITSRMVNCQAKLLLVYSRGTYQPQTWLGDWLKSPGMEKDDHGWQQSLGPALDLIERLTQPGDHVVDPFLGSGTTAEAENLPVEPAKLSRRVRDDLSLGAHDHDILGTRLRRRQDGQVGHVGRCPGRAVTQPVARLSAGDRNDP